MANDMQVFTYGIRITDGERLTCERVEASSPSVVSRHVGGHFQTRAPAMNWGEHGIRRFHPASGYLM